MTFRYASVCSGIEAATVAWEPLGWSTAWLSEIEKFPCAVLDHHYPDAPNLGDMTLIDKDVINELGPIDLLVGGTPCQSFSVAGLRKGMADPRGNLALVFLGLLNKARPRWVVWENVPGVLSSTTGEPEGAPPDRVGVVPGERVMDEVEYDETHDFRCFTAALTELRYGWAYRVLDAQYFGVAQRRRRVFVVGYLGDWRRAAAVLFERQGLCGHPPPIRETRKGVAALTANGVGTCGADDNQAQAGHLIHGPEISPAIKARDYKGPSSDGDGDGNGAPILAVTHTLRGEGFDASEDGTVRGTPIVPIAFDTTQITSPGNYSSPKPGGTVHPLASGAHPPAIAYQCHGSNVGQMGTLRSGNGNETGGVPFVPVTTLAIRGRESESRLECRSDGTANAILTPNGGRSGMGVGAIHHGMAVRRLTPRECERLQGFPDDYTLIPWRNKPAEKCPDGPRYKALGNSMAVPVMRWIGERIQQVEAIEETVQK